jgi:hypothetical protein
MKSLDRLSDDELLRELHRSLQALPDAPPALQRAAIDLWAAAVQPGGLVAAAGTLITRILAELSFDSWTAAAQAHGMRSQRAPTRHLLFSAAERDIDLRVTPGSQAFSIAGQVLGPDDAGTVELAARHADGAPSHRAQLDALGEFRIDGVVPGSYVMTLRLGADEIVLPLLDLGEPPH